MLKVGNFAELCWNRERWAIQGLEPCQPGRQLEQQRQELPIGEPQQEQPVEPEQQPGLPPCPEFRLAGTDVLKIQTEQITLPVRIHLEAAKDSTAARCW